LLAAVDGDIVEFNISAQGFVEAGRWNNWGGDSGEHFGKLIYITVNGGNLWVADKERQRVLVFDVLKHNVLGSFGQTDKPGNDLSSLSEPTSIAASGRKAVVYDSGNQRVIKLELATE
jgi:hypothetical protein